MPPVIDAAIMLGAHPDAHRLPNSRRSLGDPRPGSESPRMSETRHNGRTSIEQMKLWQSGVEVPRYLPPKNSKRCRYRLPKFDVARNRAIKGSDTAARINHRLSRVIFEKPTSLPCSSLNGGPAARYAPELGCTSTTILRLSVFRPAHCLDETKLPRFESNTLHSWTQIIQALIPGSGREKRSRSPTKCPNIVPISSEAGQFL
jgi:hypothetical protein